MGFREVVKMACLAILAPACAAVFVMGCQSNLPSVSDETVSSPCPPPIMFNSCQSLTNNASLTANGSWNSVAQTFTSTLALSPYYATSGKYSLDAAITGLSSLSGPGYNDHWLNLSFSNSVSWDLYPQMIVDMYVDPSVVAGSTYKSFGLIGANSSVGPYYSPMVSNAPTILAGYQSVTFDINVLASGNELSQGVTESYLFNELIFVINRSAPSGSQGTGNIYVSDVRLTQNCP